MKYFTPAGGSIVNISSIVSTMRPPNGSVYSATKGAVDAVTGSLAKDGAQDSRQRRQAGMGGNRGHPDTGIIERHAQAVPAAGPWAASANRRICHGSHFSRRGLPWITGETPLFAGGQSDRSLKLNTN